MAISPLGSAAKTTAEVVKAFVETELSEDNIIDLFCIVRPISINLDASTDKS